MNGIKVVGKTIPVDGLTKAEDGGFVIILKLGQTEARRKFSCAHELGHVLISDTKSKLHTSSKETPQLLREHWEEEDLCDIAAREILMPADWFESRAQRLDCGISSTLALADRFEVSVMSAARRVVELRIWPCSFIIWEVNDHAEPEKVVARVSWSASLLGFVPRKAKARPSMNVTEAFRSTRVMNGALTERLGGLVPPLDIETLRIDYGPKVDGSNYLISLLAKPKASEGS